MIVVVVVFAVVATFLLRFHILTRLATAALRRPPLHFLQCGRDLHDLDGASGTLLSWRNGTPRCLPHRWRGSADVVVVVVLLALRTGPDAED